MNSQQKRTLQAYRRIQGWLTAHPELGATPQSRPQLVASGTGQKATTTVTTGGISVAAVAQHITALNAVVDEMTANASEQEVQDRAARGATADSVRLRDDLVRNQMRHIAIIAETAIPDVVRMTAALRRPGYNDAEGIIASADAMAAAASQYKDLLIQRGLPADFIEQLRSVVAAFKRAIDARGASVGQRHHAGEALQELIQRGKTIVHTLSVLVERRYRDDNATLAEWAQVKRVTLVGVRGAAGESVVKSAETALETAGKPVQTTVTVQQPAPMPLKEAAA